jgi:hypothetical protein
MITTGKRIATQYSEAMVDERIIIIGERGGIH